VDRSDEVAGACGRLLLGGRAQCRLRSVEAVLSGGVMVAVAGSMTLSAQDLAARNVRVNRAAAPGSMVTAV
jgi:hypothetical protein